MIIHHMYFMLEYTVTQVQTWLLLKSVKRRSILLGTWIIEGPLTSLITAWTIENPTGGNAFSPWPHLCADVKNRYCRQPSLYFVESPFPPPSPSKRNLFFHFCFTERLMHQTQNFFRGEKAFSISMFFSTEMELHKLALCVARNLDIVR